MGEWHEAKKTPEPAMFDLTRSEDEEDEVEAYSDDVSGAGFRCLVD